MKTPHRLIHDAKEAGAITEQEWRAFMRARNESYDQVPRPIDLDVSACYFLGASFMWEEHGGTIFWLEVSTKLKKYYASMLEAGQ